MNVLIAAKHPPGGRLKIGGVQTWSATVGAELERRGHGVTYWGPEWNVPAGPFDLGILSNLRHTSDAIPLCGRVVKISHGIIKDETGGPDFLATSEEVRDAWGCKAVIRQPLNLDFWSPADVAKPFLTRHSYRSRLDFLAPLAESMGYQFRHLQTATPGQVRDVLRRSAVVVASGRAAVEAMACGAAVVIADHRTYQGALLDLATLGAMARNYSGRGGVLPTPDLMRQAIKLATARGSLRAHTLRYHDVRRIVEDLLCSTC